MLTDTLPNPTGLFNINSLFAGQSVTTTYDTYVRYRDVAMSLVNTNNPEIFYRMFPNVQGSINGEGIHESLLYNGRAIVDVSAGLLDFPWFAADAAQTNEISRDTLQQLIATETMPHVAWRLRQLAAFATLLPLYVRYYYYIGPDGVRALTIVDEFSSIKMNCILTHVED